MKLSRPDGYAAIHQSLLAGLLSGIAQRGDTHEYKACGGLTISLWPGSGLFSRRPQWIVAAEIVETTKRYGRTVAEVDVEWIEKAAAALLKHSYSDAHWSSRTGAAMVYRRSTLYGLPIATGRRVALASIDREAAREMLIEHGLVGGEWNCQEAFYKHNQEMLADMHELVQRTRSRDYILDRFHLAAFYNSRLAAEVYDLATLKVWIAANRGKPSERALWMQPEDLLNEQPGAVEQAFPNALKLGSTELPLEYRFEPGHAADGVAVTVPQAVLRQISEDTLGWLVPGLLEEKILWLIRALPKSLRTNFVPAPDVAKKLAVELAQVAHDRPFATVLCEAMSRHAGERISAAQFALDKLPEHLRFLVHVIDDAGKLLGSSREIAKLQVEYALPTTPLDLSSGGPSSEWSNRRLTADDFDELPQQVVLRRGGLDVAAFPALVDIGNAVEMRLSDTAAMSERLSLGGFTRLFAIQHHRSLRSQVAHLPNLSESLVKLGHLVGSAELTAQLQDLIARIALVESLPLIRTRVEFEARNVRASQRISIATQDVSTWLPRFAEQVHQVRLLTEKSPESWREVIDDIRRQQQQFFHPGFLGDTPWRWLAELPRYLQAARQRIEKLKSGGLPKDRKLRAPIDAAQQSYQSLMAKQIQHSARCEQRLVELRWTIEELRVSIFAQQLGTKISVSPKRVQALFESIQAEL